MADDSVFVKYIFFIIFVTGQAVLPLHAQVSPEDVVEHTFALAEAYFAEFQHPETGFLYGSRLAGRKSWTRPEDVLKERPKPWGYGSRIADTVLHTGHMLLALLDARAARPDPFLDKQIRIHFDALKLIGSLPETYPKPGKPAQVGLVPRGPHPDDRNAWFDDSSMDQHTTYIISLAVYANSPVATKKDKAWIAASLGKVGRRLEKYGLSIKRADGVTQAHVGFSWKGFNSSHASILLPSVLALYHGTQDTHWRDLYEHFLSEADGKRWQEVHPGPQVRINGHPIYANQNAFRVNAWYHMETNPERKKVIAGLLKQSVEMQLARDFPGEFYRKYQSEDVWQTIRHDFAWSDSDLHGADSAWRKFRPDMLDHKYSSIAALAHIRFPLGGYHMALLSENPDLIRACYPQIWKMLQTVDLDKVSAGETHYLFTVVGLHLYALRFRHPEWFTSYGPKLDPVANCGIGPTQDVAIRGNLAYAIGRKQLSIIDVKNPDKPKVLGKLPGLGSVRQIVVRGKIAYISARQDGLFIVDVQDPSKPVVLDHYDTIEFATGLALSGDILFVACRHYGVELVDISNPSAPRHISTVRTGEAQSVVARDGYLYAGVWGSSEVVTVDISDPAKPVITARNPLDGFGDGVDVEGKFLYVATGHHSKQQPRKKPGDPGFGHGHGLEVFDISDPAKPKWLSRVKFPQLYEIGADTWRVTVVNNHAFVADTHNGVFIVDVTNPKLLRFAGHHKFTGYVGGLTLIEDYILVAGGATDLHILAAPGLAKLRSPEPDESPSIGERENGNIVPQAYIPGGQIYSVAALGDNRAVVACGSDGVHIVELGQRTGMLSRYQTKGFAMDVSISGDLVYIAESAGGLTICRTGGEGREIKPIGHFTYNTQAIRQVEVPEDGRYALVQAGANQFLVLDVSDPSAPKMVLKEARHGLLYGDQMMLGLVEGRYTNVFWHVSGVHWYDLKAANGPAFSGDHYPERLGATNGQIAFRDKCLITTRGGYLLLDREEKRPLSEIGVTRVGNLRNHPGVPTISGNRLYTSNRASGLITVADISDPDNPVLIEQIQTQGNPGRVAISNGRILIPDGYNGLQVRREPPER